MDGKTLTPNTCVTNAASAEQVSAAGVFVSVPDNSPKGQAVWRYVLYRDRNPLRRGTHHAAASREPRLSVTAVVGADVCVGLVETGVSQRIVG